MESHSDLTLLSAKLMVMEKEVALKKHIADLASFVGQDIRITLNRKSLAKRPIDGFVVGIGAELLLVHLEQACRLDGYSAVRLSDIRSYTVDESFISRAMRLLKRKPVMPQGIDLSNWSQLLASSQRLYPLVVIRQEQKDPGCGFFGRMIELTPQYVVLEKVDTKGQWIESEQFAFTDITQVEFDDSYTQALAYLLAFEA